MIGWILLGAFLLLIAVFLMSDLVLYVENGEQFFLKAGLGPFRFSLFPMEKKTKAVKKEEKKEKKKKPKETSKKEKPKEETPKEALVSSVSDGIDLFRRILSPVGKFIRRIRVTRLTVRCTVGGSDAAQTAVQYGRMNGYIYGGLALLSEMFRVRVQEITVSPDFLSQTTQLTFSFELRVSVFSLLLAAFSAAGAFFRFVFQKKKQKKKKA